MTSSMGAVNSSQQAALQTALGKQAQGFVPRAWMPNQGLVLRSSLPALPAGAFAQANNVRWDGISWTTQNIGWTAQRTKTFNSGAPILEMATHWTTAGTPIYIHQAGSQVQSYDPATPGATESNLHTALSATAVPCMRSYSPNYFIYTNGVETPQMYNASTTTWGTLPGWPVTYASNSYNQPKLCENFNGRLVFANFTGYPNVVIIGDLNSPGTITIPTGTVSPANGAIFFIPSQFGPITWLKAARVSVSTNQQVLLVGCQNGFAFITGTDATNFQQVTSYSGKWGVPSNRAWFALDDNLYCLCTDGIRQFNTNTTYSNLIGSCMSYPVHPLITGMNLDYASSAFCLDNPNALEVTFYYPSGTATTNTTGVIFNYGDIGSGLIRVTQKVFPISYVPTAPACGQYYRGKFYGGGYDGTLQTLYSGNYFGVLPAQYSILSPLFVANTPVEEMSCRGMWIMTQGYPAAINASGYANVGRASTGGVRLTKVARQVLNVGAPGTTILGSWTLGQSYFPASAYDITPFNMRCAGKGFQLALSGSTASGDLNFIGAFALFEGGGTRQ